MWLDLFLYTWRLFILFFFLWCLYIYIHVSPFWIQSFCPQPCRPPIKNSKPLPQLKQHMQELCYLEFFAGQAEVFKAIRADNHPSVATDITYMMGPKNPMDILTDSGFAFKPKIFKPWNSLIHIQLWSLDIQCAISRFQSIDCFLEWCVINPIRKTRFRNPCWSVVSLYSEIHVLGGRFFI